MTTRRCSDPASLHRGRLQTASRAERLKVLDASWSNLRAQAWEELCRMGIPRLPLFDRDWNPAGRYWKGNQAEWDVVSTSLDDETVILGECKSMSRPTEKTDMDRIIRALMTKQVPTDLDMDSRQCEYVIFVPELNMEPESLPENVTVVAGKELFSALKETEEFH